MIDAHETLGRLARFFGGNRRMSTRYAVLLSGKIITATGTATVTIRDLSVSGAQVQGAFLPPLDAILILKRGDLEAAARVIWREADQAGLHFETPLPADKLLQQIRRAPPEPPVDRQPLAA